MKTVFLICSLFFFSIGYSQEPAKTETTFLNEIKPDFWGFRKAKFDVNNTLDKEVFYVIVLNYMEGSTVYASETISHGKFTLAPGDGLKMEWQLNPNISTPSRMKVELQFYVKK